MGIKKGLALFISLLFLSSLLAGCISTPSSSLGTGSESPNLEDFNNEIVIDTTNTDTNSSDSSDTSDKSLDISSDELGDITVKFIDVGQADSCLIVTSNNDAILIDAGESKDASEILSVLSLYDLEDIDLMILSHPHADHIGGAKTILESYTVNEVLMCSFEATSKLFENLLDTLSSQDVLVTPASVGLEYNIDDIVFTVLGTDSVPNDNNNSSVVVKMTYGSVDILFTGDAEESAEEIILSNGLDLSCEVLKVGHHGSETSTSDAFLSAVSPRIAIISVGVSNSYNHPSAILLQKLTDNGIQYYRTDELGTITLEIDGKDIVTSIEDNFETTNNNGSFIYSPNVAEIGLAPESNVLESQTIKNSDLGC